MDVKMEKKGVKISSEDIKPDFAGELKSAKKKDSRHVKGGRTVDDRSTSASYWTLSMMCKYISYKRDVRKWTRNSQHNCKPAITMHGTEVLFGKYKRKISFHPSVKELITGKITFDHFASFTESDVRSLLSILVSELVSRKDELTFEEEELVDLSCYPSCRLDYLLLYRQIPIGCIEAKSNTKMNKGAFTQAVIQLNVLQQWSYKHGQASRLRLDMTKMPLFNILTSGSKFIFLKLKGNKLYVEKKYTPSPKCKIRYIEDTVSFHRLFKFLCEVCDDAISSMENEITTEDETTQDERPGRKGFSVAENTIDWNTFLTPLGGSAPTKGTKRKAESINTDTISGPVSLSRRFGQELSKEFIQL